MRIDLEKFKAKKLRQLERRQRYLNEVGTRIRIDKIEKSLKKLGANFTIDPLKWEAILKNVVLGKKGCWEWTGSLTSDGYGKLQYEGQRWRVHRLTYLLAYGNIPDGLIICHTCDNPKCVSPMHLFAGTHKENREDCIKKGRSRASGKSKIRPCAISADKAILIEQDLSDAIFSIAGKYGVSADSIKLFASRPVMP